MRSAEGFAENVYLFLQFYVSEKPINLVKNICDIPILEPFMPKE